MFYRVPQVLFTDDEFRYISSEAKLLYGFLLDRTALSAKNKWTDEDGKVYVFFTQDEAKEKLNIGTGKATADNIVYNNVKVDTWGGITDGSITSIEVQNNTPKKLIITENKNFDLRSFFIITTYEYTFV